MEGQEFWARDFYLECRCRAAQVFLAFLGWHKKEVFEQPRPLWPKHYVGVPEWWPPLEPMWVLLVLSPAVFAY